MARKRQQHGHVDTAMNLHPTQEKKRSNGSFHLAFYSLRISLEASGCGYFFREDFLFSFSVSCECVNYSCLAILIAFSGQAILRCVHGLVPRRNEREGGVYCAAKKCFRFWKSLEKNLLAYKKFKKGNEIKFKIYFQGFELSKARLTLRIAIFVFSSVVTISLILSCYFGKKISNPFAT